MESRVQPWAELFGQQGLGTAVVDSFSPRVVEQVCTGAAGAWAVRRADDAYSARAWLAQQQDVDAGRMALVGMSNGGRTVLAALRTTLKHAEPFAAGVALYPGCQSDVASIFYAPLLVLIGRGDTVTPARHCERMTAAQPASAPELTLIVYPPRAARLRHAAARSHRAGHAPRPRCRRHGRRRVVEFLAVHGLIAGRQSR